MYKYSKKELLKLWKTANTIPFHCSKVRAIEHFHDTGRDIFILCTAECVEKIKHTKFSTCAYSGDNTCTKYFGGRFDSFSNIYIITEDVLAIANL